MDGRDDLLLPSGGYRRLKSFQLARLVYDITVHFVELYIPVGARTRDQMIQAARSGVQNIAEGSLEAATSAKLELNLYNVARASLEELALDYQEYLRQNGCMVWCRGSDLYERFVAERISDSAGFRNFIRMAESSVPSVNIRNIPYKSVLVANAVLLLISTASYFLKRQIDAKARNFLADGGFSERMHRMRSSKNVCRQNKKSIYRG